MNVNIIKKDIKNVFLSEQNTSYILNVLNSHLNFNKNNIHLNKNDIKEIENAVYELYFNDIYTELTSKNKFSPEETIIILNKIIITEIENFANTKSKNIPENFNTIENSKSNENLNSIGDQTTSTDALGNPEKKTNIEDSRLNNVIQLSETSLHYLHFFSEDAKKVGTKWTYKLDLQNLNSLCIETLRLNCNLYNINESNSKFELYEHNNTQVTVSIPYGYYTIDALLNTITNILNENSPNKLKYSVSRNQQKNKVYFSSFFSSTKLSSKPQSSFTIKFFPSRSANFSLGEMLGFNNLEYSNNSSYISENFPKENIYDDIYLKIRINDIDLPKYISTKYISNTDKTSNFTYFEKFSVNMNKNFGKSFVFNKSNLDHFDFNSPINSNYISFEFLNAPNYTLNMDLDFQITISFETSPVEN